MSDSATVGSGMPSLPSIAHGPPGCAAIAAGSRDTALAAAAVLRAGGNAVDAALGGMLAACISEVVFTSLGGGGFLLVREHDGEHHLMDFFVNTPGLGDPHGEEDPEFTPITVHYPGTTQVFHVGPGSVAVPGALAGLVEANARFGRLPLSEIVQPAMQLGRDGAILEPVQAVVLELVREIMSLTEECSRLIQTPHGYAKAGDRLYNVDFARFLRRIADGKVTSMLSPGFADPLMELMTYTSGHVTMTDLEHYEVATRPPLLLERSGALVALNSPPAYGGAILADVLARLDPIDGSPDSWWAAVQALVAATESNRVADTAAGIPHVKDGTTHISVVDTDGRVASMTTSNGAGSGVIHPGTGIQLNNMMGEEDLNPGGFHSLPPGIRMGSMMAPTIVTRADGSVSGFGSGGSERIRSALLSTVLNLVDLGRPVEDAIAAPRLHPGTDGIQMEPGWSSGVVRALAAQGPVNTWTSTNLFFGGVHAVTRHPDGSVTAVGDSRRSGAAAVVPLG